MRNVHRFEGVYELEDLQPFKKHVRERFNEHKVMVFPRLAITDDEFGVIRDLLGFGTAEDMDSPYKVDYKGFFESDWPSVNGILNPWHMENLYMNHPPVYGIWHMEKFQCEPGSGSTIFVDMGKVCRKLPYHLRKFAEQTRTVGLPGWFPIDRELFNSSVDETTFWFPTDVEGEEVPVTAHPLIQKHPITGEEILRTVTQMPPGDTSTREVYLNPGYLVNEFTDWLHTELEDKSNRLWQHWEQGDVVVLDIYSLAHAVTDGFFLNERLMNGRFYFGPGVFGVVEDPVQRRKVDG